MKARAIKFVRTDLIDKHLKKGWLGSRPNAMHHHLIYGIEMVWICDCEVPGGFKFDRRVPHRVPATPTEGVEHDRAGIGT